ncbi:hypothetical protein VNO80_02626 [Phaseolus coccineus]|uniref:Uncharacterized protein n=1 Tax=Phaseolus coccineus TaxID=3886 RepID=A0AAN9NQ08_PHACN
MLADAVNVPSLVRESCGGFVAAVAVDSPLSFVQLLCVWCKDVCSVHVKRISAQQEGNNKLPHVLLLLRVGTWIPHQDSAPGLSVPSLLNRV